jgi:hypothetical protein
LHISDNSSSKKDIIDFCIYKRSLHSHQIKLQSFLASSILQCTVRSYQSKILQNLLVILILLVIIEQGALGSSSCVASTCLLNGDTATERLEESKVSKSHRRKKTGVKRTPARAAFMARTKQTLLCPATVPVQAMAAGMATL